MGGGSSKTRRLTIENEESTNVIKVSDDVVNRLKGSESDPVVSSSLNSAAPGPVVQGDAHLGVPQPYFYSPGYTSLQILQEKEEALKKNDQYWEKRVSDLEEVHGQMHQIMEAEYYKAIIEMRDQKEGEDMAKFTKPPCQIRKHAVMECYKKHPKEPMKCSKEVEAFAECVDVQRATLIANRS